MLNGVLISLIAGVVLIFSMQNGVPVAASFLAWDFEVPFSVVTGAAVLAGILLAQLLQALRSKRQTASEQRREFSGRRHRW
ncbi:MAG: hypothetical protein A2010_06170 [Nitrospirae bacterium GWD2_57_9]|nr:MAG: hypothetical protein A2010_06170 [Nitrospirae bacterium GWD2_57_9]OGW47146.1 MAG: hypothetical protein A2078_12435 [Nitrospirae bacterium GWC2_57_9]